VTKQRTDAWEAGLEPEQRDRVFERLLQPFDPEAIAKWVQEEYSCPKPSRASLYRFRDRWKPEYADRRSERVLMSCESVDQLIEQGGQISDATAAQARALSLDAAMRGDYEAGNRWMALAQRIAKENYDEAILQVRRDAETRLGDSLKLAQTKFQRETCELFVKWFADERAAQIADSKGVGTDEKVEQLGKLMFGEDW